MTAPSQAWFRRPWATVLIAAAAVALVVGAGQLAQPVESTQRPEPAVEPVASADLLCPVTVATRSLVSTVSAGVAPVAGVQASDGSARLSWLDKKAETPPKPIEAPGDVVTDIIQRENSSPRVASATGSWSAGFGADQVTRSGEGATRGLAASPCARPITDGWILGGGSTVGRTTQILLVNDDDRAAQIDLLVYGPEGEIASPAGSGVVVPPLSRSVVRLAALAPDQAITAIRVVARSGRIAASALETVQDGLIPLGMAVLPVTQAARTVVIPSVPSVATARLLLVPQGGAAEASIRLMSSSGSFAPEGFGTLDLEPGKVTSLKLTEVLEGEPSGLVITSDVPVSASVVVTTGTGTQLKERDTAAGTPALVAPGIVVGLRTGLGSGTLVHGIALAAPDEASVVRLDVYRENGTSPSWTATVDVAAGTSQYTRVPVDSDNSLLVVTPVSGRVYASRQLVENGPRGPMLAIAPLLPTRATTTVPPVIDAPASSVR
ncbi:MAG: DUF5719 family protein [Actinobacteria bacterium]|nr:DUF5719 family protein [Actinomycetota bacterium]